MPIHLRRERVCAVGGGAWALAIAENQSASPDPACAYQQVIDVAARTAAPLAEPSLRHGAAWIAGASRSPVAAIAGNQTQKQGPVSLVDVARRKVTRELTAPGVFQGLALDATGARIAYVLADRVAIVDVASGREVVSVALEAGRRFLGYVAHCQGHWVVFSSKGRTWLATVLTDEGAFTGRVHPMRAEPMEVCGAGGAPVVACGVGRKLVQVIEVVTGASVVFAPHTAKDAFAAVSVSIEDDGARVISRGTDDAQMFMLGRGARHPVAVRALAATTRRLNDRDYLTQPGFAVCGSTLVTVSDGAPSFEALPAVSKRGELWGSGVRQR